MTVRIGQGVDVHAFGTGDHIVLGGVRIPHTHGLDAHSDGDAALHALCDALLGAAALGDIGRHFPDNDDAWRGADSRGLLRRCNELLAESGWHTVNVDITIVAQAPKVAPHADAMRANVAADLGIDIGAVSVKATTTERLGFTGRGDGLCALAVVLIDDG